VGVGMDSALGKRLNRRSIVGMKASRLGLLPLLLLAGGFPGLGGVW
jgi:hypothetical protein